MATKKIACLGDSSNHGGAVVTTNSDNTLFIGIVLEIGSAGAYGRGKYGEGLYGVGGGVVGDIAAVDGAQHSCPIFGHGVTPITAITTKTYHNGKLILTEGAIAGCGAVLTPPDRKVYAE